MKSIKYVNVRAVSCSLFLSQFLIVYSFLDIYILFMIFNYYLIVFRLVERFMHEPLARETGWPLPTLSTINKASISRDE